MLRNSLAAFALLGLAACGGNGDEAAPAAKPGATPTPTASATATAIAEQGGARQVAESTETYEFKYSWPATAGNIAPLRALLEQRLAKDRAAIAEQAAAGKDDAADSGYPFNPYASDTEWKVVTDLGGWLSLSAQVYQYSGGAHGNHWFDTLLWDKQAGQARDVLSLFNAKAALEAAVKDPLCDALDKEREQRRGEKVVRDADDWSSACIGLDDATVILGSRSGKAFDRIGFLIAPYNAGPYAEGSYEITLPVTRAVLDAVKPEYRAAFAALR
jgi:hypothetical protein